MEGLKDAIAIKQESCRSSMVNLETFLQNQNTTDEEVVNVLDHIDSSAKLQRQLLLQQMQHLSKTQQHLTEQLQLVPQQLTESSSWCMMGIQAARKHWHDSATQYGGQAGVSRPSKCSNNVKHARQKQPSDQNR